MVHHRSALPYQYGCDPPRTLEPSVRSCAVPRCDTSLEFDDSATANGGLSRERQPRLLFDASAAPADERAAEAAERFGEALRNHRRAAGFTQEELAERAGISPRSISGLERGEGATPRRDTVALLVNALELSAVEYAAFEGLLVRGRAYRPRLVPDPESRVA